MIRFPSADNPVPRPRPETQTIPWQPSPLQASEPSRISAANERAASVARRVAVPVLASGWRTNGPEVAAFEREFADHLGARRAVAVSSSGAAVELSLRDLRLPHGSRVLVSTLAPSSVVQSIVRAHLRPVLLDVHDDSGLHDLDEVHRAVRSTPARAMVVVHWGGDPADVEQLADAAGLAPGMMIEDAGQALGASLGGREVGATGTACFSFYSTANLPIGDGGIVTTEDPDQALRLMVSRERGTSAAARRHVQHSHLGPHILRDGGLQASLTEQSAAAGRAHLQHLAAWQLRRHQLAHRYDERLAEVPGVGLPHRPARGSGEHAWQSYAVRIERPTYEREGAVRALAAAGIGTTYVVPPLHRLAYCRQVSELPDGGLPGADRLVDQLVSLPMYPGLADSAVDRVSEVLQTTLNRRSMRFSGGR